MPTSFFSEARSPLLLLLLSTCTWTALALDVPVYEDSVDTFINPDSFIAGDFSASTALAQDTIKNWATQLAAQGPWSVITKPAAPPSGDMHDYMSFAPYFWPNCTAVGNTTELTPEEVWTKCPYYYRDGLRNPDVRVIANDVSKFSKLADAVLYNSLAWVVSNYSPKYATNAVNFVNTWFLAPETKMNPNLKYGQRIRGPGAKFGGYTGILDLKCMTNIVSGLLLLRKANSTAWTPELDSAMTDWVNSYISWLETSPVAHAASVSENNHGSYYYAQLASLKIFVGDMAGAQNATRYYFSHMFDLQIDANGEQPLEATRTRPYHYRTFNLAAIVTNARIGEFVGYDGWNHTTKSGSTIQTALDYILTVPPGNEPVSEVLPIVAAVGAAYGDPTGKYAAFLKKNDADYRERPYSLWYPLRSVSRLTSNGRKLVWSASRLGLCVPLVFLGGTVTYI